MGPVERMSAGLSLTVLLCVSGIAAAQDLKLPGEFLSFAKVNQRIAVFTSSTRGKDEWREIVWVQPTKGGITIERRVKLWEDAVGFDVCRWQQTSNSRSQDQQALLIVRPDGVYNDKGYRVVSVSSVYAHSREDRFPRLKICFHEDHETRLIIPQLKQIGVWSRDKNRWQNTFSMPVKARPRFWGARRPTSGIANSQKTFVGYEFPLIMAIDFDGDGSEDICTSLQEDLNCYIRGSAGTTKRFKFDLLSTTEKKNSSIQLRATMIDVNQDRRADIIFNKGIFELGNMGAELSIFLQKKGGFAKRPDQVIKRDGYFGYQDYVDLDGDGRLDIVAPVIELGWSDLTKIFITRTADIELVWYPASANGFRQQAQSLYEYSYPVDFKNFSAVSGALPLWVSPSGSKRRAILFPDQESIETISIYKGEVTADPKTIEAKVGPSVIAADFDRDGHWEFLFAYPRDKKRSRQLHFVNP